MHLHAAVVQWQAHRGAVPPLRLRQSRQLSRQCTLNAHGNDGALVQGLGLALTWCPKAVACADGWMLTQMVLELFSPPK